MTYVITQTIIDPWRRVLAKSGTIVNIVSDHSGVLIVEDLKGNRFSVTSDQLIKQPKGNPVTQIN